MTREEKKYLEREFAKVFLKEIGISKLPDPSHLNEPDVIIYDSDILGIEVTQIYTGIDQNGISKVATEGGWDFVLDLAQNIWINSNQPKAHVVLTFNSAHHISKGEGRKTASALVELIQNYIPEPDNSFYSDENFMILPNGIVEFHIHRYNEMDTTIWSFNDSSWPPKLTSEEVQQIIIKKEERREAYLTKCDRIWLLLVLYGGRAAGNFDIPKQIYDMQYRFGFDRIFLFDAIPKRIWQLK